MWPPIFTPISLQESPVILTAIGQVKIISVCVRVGSWESFDIARTTVNSICLSNCWQTIIMLDLAYIKYATGDNGPRLCSLLLAVFGPNTCCNYRIPQQWFSRIINTESKSAKACCSWNSSRILIHESFKFLQQFSIVDLSSSIVKVVEVQSNEITY